MSAMLWTRRLAMGGGVALLAACAQPGPPPLYLWEGFPRQQYETLQRNGASSEQQLLALEAHAAKARGTGTALPPGFRAHVGMVHLSAGNVDQARQQWQDEKAAFPESAAYMDSLLKRLDGPRKGEVTKGDTKSETKAEGKAPGKADNKADGKPATKGKST